MQQTKALYNAIRMGGDTSAKVEPWALEDLRPLPIDRLWKRLEKQGIRLEPKSFIQFSAECDTPEDLADLLIEEDKEPSLYDQAYLLLFELWRRLLPERVSLSIFGDEFDFLIDLYVKDKLETDEPLQDALAELSEVLEEHVDAGMKPKDAFAAISEYCASDLENFLYLYISDLLDQENFSYAQELYEEFSRFFHKHPTFDFLQARLEAPSDLSEANQKIELVLQKKPPLHLLFDIMQFLVTSGEHEPFQKAVRQILPQLETEAHLQELFDLSAEYYRRLDLDELENSILKIKEKRKPSPSKLKPTDPDISQLKELLLK